MTKANTPPHEATPDGWRAQYQRMDRMYGDIRPTDTTVVYHDALLTFFMHAWALKDWIKNDPTAAPAIGPQAKALNDAVRKHEALRRGRDVANGAKHRVLTQEHVGGAEAGRTLDIFLDGSPPLSSVLYRFTDGASEEGLALAHRMKQAWDTLLPSLGLNPHG